ncbi:hypothetical protein D3C75_1220440 [compost metagenome]
MCQTLAPSIPPRNIMIIEPTEFIAVPTPMSDERSSPSKYMDNSIGFTVAIKPRPIPMISAQINNVFTLE